MAKISAIGEVFARCCAVEGECRAQICKKGLNRNYKGANRCHFHSKSLIYSPYTWACCQIYLQGVYRAYPRPYKAYLGAHKKCNGRTQFYNNCRFADEKSLVRKQTV